MVAPSSGTEALNPVGADTADRLNQGCFCITLDRKALARTLDIEVGIAGFAAGLARSHAALFSNVPVFVSRAMIAAMQDVVAAIEAAARLPGYRDAAMSRAPAIALADFGPVGALMGYDFHITEAGPRLIEVNTNAGGAFLNHALAIAQRACCREVERFIDGAAPPENFGEQIVSMFLAYPVDTHTH